MTDVQRAMPGERSSATTEITTDTLAATTTATTGDTLAEAELRLLDFERAWAARTGAKEAAIRSEFGLPAARYYQMLFVLIDSPAALRHDPLLVRRLQRLRDARTRSRAARTFRADAPTTQDMTD